MKRIYKNAGFILLFIAGLLILLYPSISSRWNEWCFQKLMSEYQDSIEEGSTDYSDEKKAAEDYNHTLIGSQVPDAFSVRDNVEDKEYESLMNVNGNGIMGTIEIPAIDVSLPIYHYTTDEVLEHGVGHLFGSSLPVGGESTHCVLSAHRGLPSARLFTDLNLLEEGDMFWIKVYDETLAYEVDQIQTVEPEDTSALAIEEGKDYVTLITCTPYAVNTHRLLVRGHRIPYDDEQYQNAQKKSDRRISPSAWIHVLCALAGIGTAVFIFRILPNRSKKNGKKRKKSKR